MYRIAICDDQKEIVSFISDSIKKIFDDKFKTYLYDNSFSLEIFIDELLKGNLDILIIDIDLGNDNGIEVAGRIKKKYPHIKIIFATAHSNYAGDIFETEPVYFLIKPIESNKLQNAINLAIKKIEADKKENLSITSKGVICNLDLRKIIFIESFNRTVEIYEMDQKRKFYIKLNDIEKMLTERFCRCHQSFIVNWDYVSDLCMYQITLTDEKIIPVSQSQYKKVKQSFTYFLGEKI